MTGQGNPERADLSPAEAWSQRVRKVGGFIQLAFAAFWLVRGAWPWPSPWPRWPWWPTVSG
jgi:hypothetical protein